MDDYSVWIRSSFLMQRVTAVNVFVLFLLLTFILFNPVRNMLKKRQDKITSDRENAENDKKGSERP